MLIALDLFESHHLSSRPKLKILLRKILIPTLILSPKPLMPTLELRGDSRFMTKTWADLDTPRDANDASVFAEGNFCERGTSNTMKNAESDFMML